MTDLIILATLLPGAQHGYSLKRQAGLILGQENLHNNLVYPLLRRFVANRWVSKQEVPGQRGQTRQLYSLTALGKKELILRLSTLSEQDARDSNEFRLRVGMFQVLGPDARLRILEARQAFLRSRLEKLASIEKNFDLDRYAREVTRRFLADSETEVNWIEHLRRISK